MTAALLEPAPQDAPWAATVEDEIEAQVQSILGKNVSTFRCNERRLDRRCPFPHLFQLTPVEEDGLTPIGETITVVGRHVSRGGLDFYHRRPLPYRRMIASLPAHHGRTVDFLIDLSWCRFVGNGWYDNGGRFLQVIHNSGAVA